MSGEQTNVEEASGSPKSTHPGIDYTKAKRNQDLLKHSLCSKLWVVHVCAPSVLFFYSLSSLSTFIASLLHFLSPCYFVLHIPPRDHIKRVQNASVFSLIKSRNKHLGSSKHLPSKPCTAAFIITVIITTSSFQPIFVYLLSTDDTRYSCLRFYFDHQ